MRCPKCGFFSFDHLETCKKCHKNLADIVQELNGTTYESVIPQFLVIDKPEPPRLQPGHADGGSSASSGEMEIELGELTDSEFLFEQDAGADASHQETGFQGGIEDLVLDFEELSEVSPRDEFTLDVEAQPEQKEPPSLSMDFGDLDISDLAPPVKEQAKPLHFEEQPVLSDVEPVATLSQPQTAPPPPPASKPKAGLEDLNFNGLDLDTPSKLVTGSAAGKRFLPSVKTGTALDKFDIDLGELFAEKK